MQVISNIWSLWGSMPEKYNPIASEVSECRTSFQLNLQLTTSRIIWDQK